MQKAENRSRKRRRGRTKTQYEQQQQKGCQLHSHTKRNRAAKKCSITAGAAHGNCVFSWFAFTGGRNEM